jgi:hypothetical protein
MGVLCRSVVVGRSPQFRVDDWREKGAPIVESFKVEIRKALEGMDILLVNQ